MVEKNVRVLDFSDIGKAWNTHSLLKAMVAKSFFSKIHVLRMNNGTASAIRNLIFTKMHELKHVWQVELVGVKVYDLDKLSYLGELKKLSLSFCTSGNKLSKKISLHKISDLTGLTSLDISGTQIENNDLKYLCNMMRLRDLNLSHNDRLSANGIRYLYNLPSIINLDLTATPNIKDKSKFWHNRAAALYNEERIEESLNFLNIAIEYDPDNYTLIIHKARALVLTKRFFEAIEFYDKALTMQTPTVNVLLEKGRILRRVGKFLESIYCFDEVLKLEPTNTRAMFRKGTSLFKLSMFEEALECFNTLEKHRKLNDDYFVVKTYVLEDKLKQVHCYSKDMALFLQGDALYGLNRTKEALEKYFKAIVFNTKHPDVFYESMDYKSHKDVITIYNKALSLNNRDESVVYTLGLIWSSLGDYKQAIECFIRTTDIDPTFSPAWDRQGEILQMLGRDEEALNAHITCLKQDEYRLNAWVNWVKVLKKLGRDNEVEETIKLATKSLDKKLLVDKGLIIKSKSGHHKEQKDTNQVVEMEEIVVD